MNEDLKYDISFDKSNANCILIKELNGKPVTYIACPPIKNGCDIINFEDKLKDYTYDFNGLIIITTEEKREIYHRGFLIAQTKRKIWK